MATAHPCDPHWAFWNWRRQLVSPVRGCVLEIGCGTGPTFRHYHPSCAVWAIEPEMDRCRAALTAAQTCRARVQVQQGHVQALPFPTGCFDVVLASLVLCSVPHQQEALTEIQRVLRPAGMLALMEHVLPMSRGGSWLAHAVQPWWSTRFAGCRPNRDTIGVLTGMGWRIRRYRRTACIVRGVFTPPPRLRPRQTPQGCATIKS